MNSKKIFHALQQGEITPEEAKKALLNIAETGSKDRSCMLSATPSRIMGEQAVNSIAVIGMAGQFPKSKNVAAFWDAIAQGRDCISVIPSERWHVGRYYDPDMNARGKTSSRWMGALEDVDMFDPLFFNISPVEAEMMDPQQRLFLENCWHCIEDSGLSPSSLAGTRTGVFVGCAANDYGRLFTDEELNAQNFMGVAPSMLAARISYALNLKGPCLAIDTACSSSLVALAEACNSLILQTSDLGLAGGVYAGAGPWMHIMTSKAGMLSKDGRCFTFDHRANGFVPGEGVGAVLLKRLADAERDRDPIYGVIRGWGVNQDGKTNGITAPSANSQYSLEKQVYEGFHIDPGTISLVEAHGTATKLGDPIEVEALTRSFRAYTQKSNYCALGSVKSNIGHLLAAAGVAGLIKVLLCLRHRKLPPAVNFEKLNEHISLDESPFYINTRLQPWDAESPRRACVSSFGFSGTNAHIVVEEYSPETGSIQGSPAHPDTAILFVLSAKNRERLQAYAEEMRSYIVSHEDLNLEDMAYTLQAGRDAMDYRLAIIADSREKVLTALKNFIQGDSPGEFLVTAADKNKLEMTAFRADEDAETLLRTWINKKKIRNLAELWVNGLDMNWDRLYDDPKPGRISLPGYPFARERYWIPEGGEQKIGGCKASNGMVRESEEKRRTVHPAINRSAEIEKGAGANALMLVPVWDAVPAEKDAIFPGPADRIIIIGGDEHQRSVIQQHYSKAEAFDIRFPDTVSSIVQKLQMYGAIDHVFWIAPDHAAGSIMDDLIIEQHRRTLLVAFRMIKALLGLDYESRNLGWTFITSGAQPVDKTESVDPAQASLHGLIGSMAKEHPNWRVRVVDHEPRCDWPLTDILMLPPDSQGNAWVYRGREWHRRKYIHFDCSRSGETLYRRGGVYVVIGGAGGIGEAWTEYMIQTYAAHVIWINRRQENSQIQAKMERLSRLGPAPLYINADATSRGALDKAYQQIKQLHSQIHGVIHAAMIIVEGTIAEMDEEQFLSGISAKADVSVRIAQVFQQEPLDFVGFFSSICSFTKNRRYSSYASGCAFKDAYARRLSLDWKCPVKVINWGYWGSVGPVAHSRNVQSWMERAGIGSIEPMEGMAALESLLSAPVDQIALVKATKPSGLEGTQPEDEEIVCYPEESHSVFQGLRSSVSEQLSQVDGLTAAKQMGTVLTDMEYLLRRLLHAYLVRLGGNDRAPADIKSGLNSVYHKWFDESLRISGSMNLHGSAGLRSDAGPADMDALWREWGLKKEAWLKNPGVRAHVTLVEKTVRALSEILTGKILATDVMFPKSSLKLVEGIYKQNPVSDYSNRMLADIVAQYVEQRLDQDPSARIRVIEIGAGTGGTSAGVFDKLRPYHKHVQEYCYTDVSRAFLLHAEEEYGLGNPYLVCRMFDVESPFAGQGIGAGEYDIVIAANVLHATRNIRQTVRNVKGVLRKNGLLILNELSGSTVFGHLTFGLLEGWWRYEDQALRISGCPGLLPETWKRVLESEGYRSVWLPAAMAWELGERIIVAESDGIVRRKQVKTAPVGQSAGHKQDHSLLRAAQSPGSAADDAPDDRLLTEQVTNVIIRNVSTSLKIGADKLDPDEAFADYGVDSILGVNLVQRINQVLKIELETSVLFDHSSINKLSNHILSRHKDHMISMLGHSMGSDMNQSRASDQMDSHPASQREDVKDTNVFLSVDSKRIERGTENIPDSIAVIGMSGQFPDARNVNQFWSNLITGHDAVREFPAHYLDQDRYFSSDRETGKTYTKWGGILEYRDCFDPSFFNISPREAESMNPHQRLILQEGWKALEDAGYNPKRLSDSPVGMFIGAEPSGYLHKSFTGYSEAIVASRLSYYLNLNGPALVVNTGCSSSGVAIHLACESLRTRESSIAIAGGVYANITESTLISLSEIEMLSPSGKCHPFDESADGTILSEGVGVVVLKRLADAVSAGDRISGIILGSGINQDGASNGITAPNGSAQEKLITGVYTRYGIDPQDITYIEAHGTGTKLGDPVEANALIRAFKQFTNKEQYCAVGSAKSVIGHTAAASGVIGLIKILLAVQHHKIPGLMNFKKINPLIDLTGSAFYMNTELSEWSPNNSKPLMAALNSFGHSGTNVHLVIQEHIDPVEVSSRSMRIQGTAPVLVPLSARNRDRLRDIAGSLVEWLKDSEIDLSAAAYTLQTGREAMEERVVFLVRDIPDLIAKLQAYVAEKENISDCWNGSVGDRKKIGRLFATDEDMQEAVKKWIVKGKLRNIAESWTEGFQINWELFYGEKKPRRVSLPTYLFARERYWIPEAKGQESGSRGQGIEVRGQESGLTAATVSIFDKPSGILLRPLSDDQIPTEKPVDRIRQSIAVPPTGITLSQPRVNNEAQPVTHVHADVSRESLQEDLKMSLSEALYMKRSNIDIDKKFTEMGLDSIIGVEWVRAINKQYGTSIAAIKIYDHLTIREFARFMEKELNNKAGELNRTLMKSSPSISLDDVLQKVQQGSLDIQQADQLLHLNQY